MYQPARIALVCSLVLLPLLLAQPAAPADDEEYKRLYTTPEKPIEFWTAIQVELDRGSYEVAGKWLRALVAKKPTDKELQEIADKDGTIAVMRLRNVRNWTSDARVLDATVKDAERRIAKAKEDKEGRPEAERFQKAVARNVSTMKDAEAFIEAVQAAVRKRAGDAGYVRGLIGQLGVSPEEKSFAIRELNSKVGAAAVPYLLESLTSAKDSEERLVLRQALERMGEQALPPLLAGLGGYTPATRLEILDLLRGRQAARASAVVPFLWYPSANRAEDAGVRKKALNLISDFTSTAASRLVPAKVALAREAEKYYRKEVKFGEGEKEPGSVTVWRWDDKAKTVVAAEANPARAREFYGRRFAWQALDLDPEYLPAQVIFLSLALEEAAEAAKGAKDAKNPALAEQLNKADVGLLLEVLDRALREERPNVALPVIEVLGKRAEVRAKRPLTKGEPALVRALYAKDARVRLAAARALLAIPGEPPPHAKKRILDILGHLLTPATSYRDGRKVLVAIAEEGWRTKAKQAVTDLGARPVAVTNGRDAMRALRGAADIDAVLLESTLPLPGLAHLLAQIRADADFGKVPVLVAAVPETRAAVEAANAYRDLEVKKAVIDAELREHRERLADLDAREAAERRGVFDSPTLSRPERSDLFAKIDVRYRTLRTDADRASPGVVNGLRRAEEVDAALRAVVQRYDIEAQVRESELTRFLARYPAVTVVPASTFSTTAALAPHLKVSAAEVPAFTGPEQAELTEAALTMLHGLAVAKPARFDVQPLTAVLLDALKVGRLTPEGQGRAIEVASRLPGARPQAELAAVAVAAGRPAGVRLAAAQALLMHRQRFGAQLPAATVAALRAEAARAGADAELKEKLDLLNGSLGAEPRSTGDRLRDYVPTPAAPPEAKKG